MRDNPVIKIRTLLPWMIALAYLVYHVVTLARSPMPWSDETYFASISHSLIDGLGFEVEVCPLCYDFESGKLYGPVYFWFTSLVWKVFDFGIFQFRVVSLVFGLLSLLLAAWLLKGQGASMRSVQLFLVLLGFDTNFGRSFHGGRMETCALFFILAAMVGFLKFAEDLSKKRAMGWGLFSGLCAALAFLTTPRSGILLLSLCFLSVFFLSRGFRSRNGRFAWFLAPCVFTFFFLTGLWIRYAFGDVWQWLGLYLEPGLRPEITLGISMYRYEYPMVVVFIFTLAASVFLFRRESLSPFIFLCVCNIILFSCLVRGPGSYSVFVAPFLYMTCVLGYSRWAVMKQKIIGRVLLGSLVLMNLALFNTATHHEVLELGIIL